MLLLVLQLNKLYLILIFLYYNSHRKATPYGVRIGK